MTRLLLPHFVFLTACVALLAQDQPAFEITPITYGQATLAPMAAVTSFKLHDWDGDGLNDVLILQDKVLTDGAPRLVWSRNVGTAIEPRFTALDECPMLLEHADLGFFAIADFDGDGKMEIVTAGGKQRALLALQNTGTSQRPEWSTKSVIGDDGKPCITIKDTRVGGPTLAAADLDGDGKPDLLLGSNHPAVMLHAFGTDPGQQKPAAGRVYWARNLSTPGQLRFATPQMLTAKGLPIECFGFVYPCALDLDGDARPDLVLGEHKPGTRLFRHRGAEHLPDFEPMGVLTDDAGSAVSSSLFSQWDAADLTGDGRADLVTSSFFGSPTWLHWLRRTKGWSAPAFLPVLTAPDSPLVGPGISTVTPVDFDGDGDLDLLLGAEPGVPMIAENIGSERARVFAPPRRLRWVDGSPVELYCVELGDGSHHGPWEWYDDRVTPRLADWDGDGAPDLISGTQGRRLHWMKGRRVEGELRFEKPRIFTRDGKPMLHPHRSLPAVFDWNGDGKLDLVALLESSDLAVYPGHGGDALGAPIPLLTTAGEPVRAALIIISPDINTSPSGRTGIAVADWDGDGRPDLITHKHYMDGRVLLHRQAADGRFEPPVKLLHFPSHLAGPSVVDWNGDGRLDILLGGDYRRLCGFFADLPTGRRAHYYVISGKSLSVPAAEKRR